MAPFFYAVYALVVLLVSALVGALPGGLARLLLPFSRAALVAAAAPVAIAWWIWAGWLDGPYGISRFGLVVFAAFSSLGFVRGWILAVDAVRRPSGAAEFGSDRSQEHRRHR